MHTFTTTFAGRPESVAKARRWLEEALDTPLHPPVPDEQRATAALLLSELATNAIQHSTSALTGHTFTITTVVWPLLHTLCVEVEDAGGGPGLPHATPATPERDTGRGLALVEAFATAWGPLHNRPGVLFFLAWQPDPHAPRAAS